MNQQEDFRLMEKLFWAIILAGLALGSIMGHAAVSVRYVP